MNWATEMFFWAGAFVIFSLILLLLLLIWWQILRYVYNNVRETWWIAAWILHKWGDTEKAKRALKAAIKLEGESRPPCCRCGEPVVEFSIKNEIWNRVIRKGGPETDREYLCIQCFADELLKGFNR